MKKKTKKIGEILMDNGLITQAILDEALRHQDKFGGNITQYLISHNYVTEENIAKSVSSQFGFPYLPIQYYTISKDVINLVPVSIVKKHLLMPVDRIKDILTVVMLDPFDEEAIDEVEKTTGCNVQAFVGLISDIVQAINHYYHITIDEEILKEQKTAPLFIETPDYRGIEHRRSIRIKARVDIHFPVQDLYKRSKTKDVSMHGFLFESENFLPVGSYATLEIDLPKEFSPCPIAAVVQVVRVVPLGNKRFDIGARLVKMVNEDLESVIKYATTS